MNTTEKIGAWAAVAGASKAWRAHHRNCPECKETVSSDYTSGACPEGARLLQELATLNSAARQ